MKSINSLEYQRRHSRLLSQTNNETNYEPPDHVRKKSCDMSMQSQYHLHPFYHRSESLINLSTSNTPTNNQIKPHGRHSICGSNYKLSKNFPYLYDHQNLQIISKHSRHHSERSSNNRKKHPLTIHTNPVNHRGKHLHYVTYKRKKSFSNSNPIPTSSTSENSFQRKLSVSITDTTEKFRRSFKK
jgi:hypothetical protein